MKIFDPIHTPLSGTNLIEASAGTGKTYIITWLFLRLILEEYLAADQILIVTFTKAATEELKERIRNKLLQAKSAFSEGSSDDILIDMLVKKHDNPDLAVQIIQDALVDFDHIAIFTIHGFCQRILHENAFETQSFFDIELVAEQINYTQEVVDDFWREHFYHMPPEFISYALNKSSGPEHFLTLLTKKTAPDIKIIPELQKPSIESLDEYRIIFEKLRIEWSHSRDEVMSVTGGLKDPSLSGTVYGSLKTQTGQANLSIRDLMVFSLTDAMDRFIDSKSIGFPLFKTFEKFTATKLVKSTKKNKTTPRHKIFDICDELYKKSIALEAEMERYLLYLETLLFKCVQSYLSSIKKETNILFFDDLLLKVRKALVAKGDDALATAIRKKYKAALLDEFQDTDPIQYEIFTHLFASKQSTLFMIGDPKQAIYGFRGADIFSYMKAARNVDSKYTLIENWRSNPGLISAVNTIFSNINDPFVFDQIQFDKGVPGAKTASANEQAEPPLMLWYLASEKNLSKPKPLSKSEAVPLIAEAVAGEISRLIDFAGSEGQKSESSSVKPGDIAVLVRTNRQAQIVKQSLSSKGIPSVLYHTGNIFHTHEAMELERILSSISEPGNERLFKAALATDIVGVAGREFDSEVHEAHGWEKRSIMFREYFRLWNRYGFIRMFSLFMTKENVKKRLLFFPDGERRLTNVLHLAEILHHESVEKKTGMIGLLKWLSVQRNAATPESEHHLLRLESDDDAVKIVTMHKSKGLEYPIVFCPFAWDGSLIKDKAITFHNINQKNELTLDLGSDQKNIHTVYAQNERLAENLRLLYVALTRAIKRCYLVWGRFNTAETSALAYLFHYHLDPRDHIKNGELITSMTKGFLEKSDENILTDLNQLAKKSQGGIKVAPMPMDGGVALITTFEEEKRSYRRFSGKIDTSWKTSSYSYMISQKTPEHELPDRDIYHHDDLHTHESDSDIYEKTDIFSFPKGVRAGTFFHDIFEHLDFTSVDPEHKTKLVADNLKDYGFEPKWIGPVCSMISNVLSLPIEEKNGEAFTLNSVHCEDRINEMEFYFPLNQITPHQLRKVYITHERIDISGFPDRMGKLTFPISKGFMKGYIDIVFRNKGRYYLLDWKSNFLGSHVAYYNQDALNEVMNHEYYTLQYHLYTLALHQYLRMRQPNYCYETHFGGVIYLFIRGIDPDQGREFGVYQDRPRLAFINDLGKTLIPGYSV